MKHLLITTIAAVVLVGCTLLTTNPLNKFWFQYNGQQEPGFRLWERDDNGIWTETYPSGHQSKFKADGRGKVNGLVGDYVVKLSGDIEKTGTQDGGFRVFIPDYQKKESFLYFSQKSPGNSTNWRVTNFSIIVLATRDGEKVEDMPEEITELLRQLGGKTGEELKGGEPVTETAQPDSPTAKAPTISIHDAAETGNIEAVKQHLAAGTEVDAKNDVGWTPLQIAAGEGQKEISALLIAKGADVNAMTADGLTVFFAAILGSNKEIIELLIAKGANVNVRGFGGMTPLNMAADEGQKEIADLLRKHGGKTAEELKSELK